MAKKTAGDAAAETHTPRRDARTSLESYISAGYVQSGVSSGDWRATLRPTCSGMWRVPDGARPVANWRHVMARPAFLDVPAAYPASLRKMASKFSELSVSKPFQVACRQSPTGRGRLRPFAHRLGRTLERRHATRRRTLAAGIPLTHQPPGASDGTAGKGGSGAGTITTSTIPLTIDSSPLSCRDFSVRMHRRWNADRGKAIHVRSLRLFADGVQHVTRSQLFDWTDGIVTRVIRCTPFAFI